MPSHPNTSVKLVEVCSITPQPSPSIDASTSSLNLTYFDMFWLRFPPVERLYFYKSSSASSSSSNNSIIESLKASLSLVLQHFLPLAGTLTWPEDSSTPVLTYVEGDAVTLVVSETEVDNFHHLSSHTDLVEAMDYHPLVPNLDVSHDQAAALALQVTLFPGRGFVVGTTMHHAILDGKTSTSFVKSWAHACMHILRNNSVTSTHSDFSLPDELKPFYDRTVVHDPTGVGLQSLYSKAWQEMDGQDNRSVMLWDFKVPPPQSIRRVFKFTRRKLQTLRQMALDAQIDAHPVLHLSTFALISAYMWPCLANSHELDDERLSMVGFMVDCRARLDHPIHANYFGNCVRVKGGFMKAKELKGEDGFVVALRTISEVIEGLKEKILDGEIWISKMKNLEHPEGLYTVAGSHRFQIYETDFEWGRLEKVEVVSIDRNGAYSLSESKNGDGGVETGVVMVKDVIVLLLLLMKILETIDELMEVISFPKIRLRSFKDHLSINIADG